MGEQQPTSVGKAPEVAGFAELRLLGHGGFSSVYEATDDVLQRKVALKVLKTDTIDDRRFHKECRILASLSEVEGIVSVFQATATLDGRPVIVMRMYLGGTLGGRVRRQGPLGAAEGVKLGAILAAALGTAHLAEIFHRDVKPSNVLFDNSGEPVVSDFGIAVSAVSSGSSETLGSLSPPHAPPERFGDDINTDPVAGDVYSLGSTLYYALAGRCPFGTASDDGGLAALMDRVVTVELPPIERNDVSAGLNAVLHKAMAKEPRERFDSMEGFLTALRSCHPTALSSWTAPSSEVIHAGSVPVAGGISAGELGQARTVEEASDEGTTGDDEPPVDGPRVPGGTESVDQDDAVAGYSTGDGRIADGGVVAGHTRLTRTGLWVLVSLTALAALALGAWSVQRALTTSDRETAERPQDDAAKKSPDGDVSTSTTTTSTTTVEPITSEPIEALAPGGFVTSTESAAALAKCTFTGSGLLAQPLAQDATGGNHLGLAPGTAILTCADTEGFARQGTFILGVDFEQLTYTAGTGGGSGAITWADGATSRINAGVTLLFPEVEFEMSVESGPFVGQSGRAKLVDWEPLMQDGTNTIIGMRFEPTRLEMSGG